MLVTQIEDIYKNKYKVYLDYKLAFVLYKGELQLYGILENEEIDSEKYEEILNKVLFKRAKNRALYLLGARDYSEYMLKQKLLLNHYPESVIDRVISFLQGYHYINDEAFAMQYIRVHGKRKSLKDIKYQLSMKGIASDIIESSIMELNRDDKEALLKHIRKRYASVNKVDDKFENRIATSLMRKGFCYREIRCCIEYVKNEHN